MSDDRAVSSTGPDERAADAAGADDPAASSSIRVGPGSVDPEADPGPPGSPDDGGSGSKHVRAPQQERSRRTLARIVDAARGIIAEEGVRAATVSRVVERANSSVGSFYARFQGKDDLLRYLEERVWSSARERWIDAMASRPWDELELEGVVRTVVQLLVRIRAEDPGARRALERDGEGPGGVGEEARRFHARVETDVTELLLRHRGRIDHPDPERAAVVAYRWAVGGIRELLSSGDGASGNGMDADVVSEEVSRGLVAYLAGGSGGPAVHEDVEFFDVWQ